MAAASAAERAECEARFAAASKAALASGAPTPFRGPAADSALGERFLDVIGLICAQACGDAGILALYRAHDELDESGRCR